MSTLLLDANVWVATLDPNDPNNAPARRLIGDAVAGRPVAALDLTLYEVANVAVRSWRSADDAHTLVSLVRTSCPGTIVSIDAEHAIALADEHELSLYDAAYVAAAQLRGWTLVSGDHADLVKPGLAIDPAAALDG
jgi:predicted nucleic acid-binding protein